MLATMAMMPIRTGSWCPGGHSSRGASTLISIRGESSPGGGCQQAGAGHCHLVHAELPAHEEHSQYGSRAIRQSPPWRAGRAASPCAPPVHGTGEVGRIRIHYVLASAGRITVLMATANRPRGTQQAIRVVEIADGTGRQEGGQHGVDQQIDLADRDAEQRRYHQGADLHHTRMVLTPLGPHQHVDLAQEGVPGTETAPSRRGRRRSPARSRPLPATGLSTRPPLSW